jgi:hypothetical protein
MFPRGSESRRWDLHLHTPETILNNQFGDWEEYLKTLEAQAFRNQIPAVLVKRHLAGILGKLQLRVHDLQEEHGLRFGKDIDRLLIAQLALQLIAFQGNQHDRAGGHLVCTHIAAEGLWNRA